MEGVSEVGDHSGFVELRIGGDPGPASCLYDHRQVPSPRLRIDGHEPLF